MRVQWRPLVSSSVAANRNNLVRIIYPFTSWNARDETTALPNLHRLMLWFRIKERRGPQDDFGIVGTLIGLNGLEVVAAHEIASIFCHEVHPEQCMTGGIIGVCGNGTSGGGLRPLPGGAGRGQQRGSERLDRSIRGLNWTQLGNWGVLLSCGKAD